MKDLEQLSKENKKLLQASLINAGIDPGKVQVVVTIFLEVIRDNNLNPAEVQETLKQVKNKMDYSLSRVSAVAWIAAALEDANA